LEEVNRQVLLEESKKENLDISAQEHMMMMFTRNVLGSLTLSRDPVGNSPPQGRSN
jgi:hypothetical protein